VEDRWRAAWGGEVVEAARRQIAQRPALDLSFTSDEAAKAYAVAHGGVSLASHHVRLANTQSIPSLEGFSSGGWWVQDLAASLPARLIPAGAGAVLDLCSAPGGKAMQMAAAGHRITAVDLSETRLKRLAENLERTGHAADLVAADALEWQPERQFDAVLLDAPCSATGTFRRHPEVLYRARPRLIADSMELQQRLLSRAADWVKRGGAIVYSVCSLEPEEGEEVVERFLGGRQDFKVAAAEEGELPAFVSPGELGLVRILPGLLESDGGLDGFFVARLVRTPV
jgi:16S rRNA (cytosine967-C5)-methyltransferase